MEIEFKDGKKIITHSSGAVSETSKEDLVKFKSYLLERKKVIEECINRIEKDLERISIYISK